MMNSNRSQYSMSTTHGLSVGNVDDASPTDPHLAMDKNLPTHLFRPVDEIVRLVPIPGINISLTIAFIKIIEIIPFPDDHLNNIHVNFFQATVDEALF